MGTREASCGKGTERTLRRWGEENAEEIREEKQAQMGIESICASHVASGHVIQAAYTGTAKAAICRPIAFTKILLSNPFS
jgi:hypothetical protein